MVLILLAGLIGAITAAWVIHPLMKAGQIRWALAAGAFIALFPLGLYLLLGSPDLPAYPALFD